MYSSSSTWPGSSLRACCFICLSVLAPLLAVGSAAGQSIAGEPTRYHLLTGSAFVIECPICALAPITLPLQGTFQLRAIEYTPAYALYAVTNVDWQAGDPGSVQYRLTGAGTFQAPGLPSFGQNMLLDLQVFRGTNQLDAAFTNSSPAVTVSFPGIQVSLDQTNGTATSEFHLKLLAAPEVRINAARTASSSGGVRLEWAASGLPVQVEKETNVNGPFLPLGAATTSDSYQDLGALTNGVMGIYRLRQQGP